MLKNWLANLVKAIVAAFDFAQILHDAVIEAINEFDMMEFVDRFGDAIADAIAAKFESDPEALQALVQKILNKLG